MVARVVAGKTLVPGARSGVCSGEGRRKEVEKRNELSVSESSPHCHNRGRQKPPSSQGAAKRGRALGAEARESGEGQGATDEPGNLATGVELGGV